MPICRNENTAQRNYDTRTSERQKTSVRGEASPFSWNWLYLVDLSQIYSWPCTPYAAISISSLAWGIKRLPPDASRLPFAFLT
jgi:hypothetical protein